MPKEYHQRPSQHQHRTDRPFSTSLHDEGLCCFLLRLLNMM